jgi:hypothetical protein
MKVRTIIALDMMLAVAVAAAAGVAPAAEPIARRIVMQAQEPIAMHIEGMFEVKVMPQTPDNDAARAAGLVRLSLDKRFNGPLEGTSQGEMLADGDGSKRDGAYVAIERFAGTLDGRAGGFALVHRALLRDRKPEQWTVTVVPGSGTGALAGLEGEMRIRVEDGKHFYELDYTLPERAEAGTNDPASS